MRGLLLGSIFALVAASAGTANATPICDGDGCSDGSYGRCCDSLCGCAAPLVCNFEDVTIGICVTPDELPKDSGVPETSPADDAAPVDSATDAAATDSASADAPVHADGANVDPALASKSDGGCSCRAVQTNAAGEGAFAACALALAVATRRRRRA
jgi:MYXO-CTERM domain-containing protein